MSGLGWGADGRLLSFVIPDLSRDPPQRRSHGPRIKSGVTMINRAATGRSATPAPISSEIGLSFLGLPDPPLQIDRPKCCAAAWAWPPCHRNDLQASSTCQPCDATLSPSVRSEEHTSELQSLMRISYAVFCLKKKKNK